MLGHTGSLWQYLGSFVGYTLFAIGLIYGAYWFLKRNPSNWLSGSAFQKSGKALEMEASLTLEPRKVLYIVRAGHERFLISSALEKMECMAKLESETATLPVAPDVMMEFPDEEEPVALPWFAAEKMRAESKTVIATKPSGLGARLMQSVQWLIESRTRSGP